MFSRWPSLGIRTQIMIIVMVGAILTTAVTLVIADTSIQNYGSIQERTQATNSLRIARLALTTQFGDSVSIDTNGNMVIDNPDARTQGINDQNHFGINTLATNTNYVDQVHTLLDNAEVSVYQCASKISTLRIVNGQLQCQRISTTLLNRDGQGNLMTTSYKVQGYPDTLQTSRAIYTPDRPALLSQSTISLMGLTGNSPHSYIGNEMIGSVSYITANDVLTSPDGHIIGVLSVSQPLTAFQNLINTTTLALIVSGIVIMLAGIILAILVASSISSTLRNAANQMREASMNLARIADLQKSGSNQQVLAINAINLGLNQINSISTDVAQQSHLLTEQGSSVYQHRHELNVTQYESIFVWMMGAAGRLSQKTNEQVSVIDTMKSAMEAVKEIADQVDSSSNQTAASARGLDEIVESIQTIVNGKAPERVGSDRQMMSRRPMNDRGMAMPDRMHSGNEMNTRQSGMPNRQMTEERGRGYDERGRVAPPSRPRPMLPGTTQGANDNPYSSQGAGVRASRPQRS